HLDRPEPARPMSTHALRALVTKDVLVYLKDRRAVLLSLAAPLALASFMAMLFGGIGGGSQSGTIPIRLVDDDATELSGKLVEAITGDKSLAAERTSQTAGRDAVRKGKATVAIVIPKGFGASAGRAMFGPVDRPVVTLLADPSHNAELGMVRGLLTQH